MMGTKLSDRIRSNCEAAPWVCEEVQKLEQQRDELLAALQRMERQGLFIPPYADAAIAKAAGQEGGAA